MPEYLNESCSPLDINQAAIYLSQFDGADDSNFFGQALVAACRTFPGLNLQGVENILRQIGSDTYLIGYSMEGVNKYDARLPGTYQLFPFYAWIELNGQQAAFDRLKRAGINPDINFQRLSVTGLLVPKPGIQLLKPPNAVYS
jgi:hypothetical protein